MSAQDPKPLPPEPPLPSDCCDSGCAVCVHDTYAEELQYYREQLAAWTARQSRELDGGPASSDASKS
ncbi:oxidoreductase-like domain-containing protein [Luteimonas terrae]|uniref:Oxidoreductase-like protein n=1 Tax=Luteimonas terrae TaxID=1530191 RepID=A0A4R5U8M9_9GAMM|nr:oxidoreductase-like domain-containing protein [Luteimonas terrae]TDK30835.1 oxidoreductase-like protein [Luteimonas terrae]